MLEQFPPLPSKSVEVFLPAPSSSERGQSSSAACAARIDRGGNDLGSLASSLPSNLADLFGGSPSDYKVASFTPTSSCVFFTSWAARESAIGRSPLSLGGELVHFTDWVEPGEIGRGQLRHKVWLRLVGWPIYCWTAAEVRAAVNSFGELWEIDDSTLNAADVSSFRALVRCSDVHRVPGSLDLWVEDRRFRVGVVVESWDDAVSILLGEDEDQRLGLLSRVDQDLFQERLSGPRRPPRACSPSRGAITGGGDLAA